MSIFKASVILGFRETVTEAGVCTVHAISELAFINTGFSNIEAPNWFLDTPVTNMGEGSGCPGAVAATDARTDFNIADDGLQGSPKDLHLEDNNDGPMPVPTSTGVMDKDGPKSEPTLLTDAAAAEMVFIAGTGTTDAVTADLFAIETDIGTAAGGLVLAKPATDEFGISSTVVDDEL